MSYSWYYMHVCTCLTVVALGHTSRLQKRKSETKASPRKRHRSETEIAQSSCLPTPQLRHNFVVGDEQVADSRSPVYDSFASTPSTPRNLSIDSPSSHTRRSQSIDSSTSITTEIRQSFTVDRADYAQLNQPVGSAQGSKRLHIIPAETNSQHQGLPTWMRLRQSHQQNIQSLRSLICAVGTLPKLVLERAVSPQTRWNEYGVEYQIDPRDANLEPRLKVLFLDPNGLWQVLQHLVSIAAVSVEKSNDKGEVYFYHSTFAEHVDTQERTYWVEQALWLFCYVFPRNTTTL